MFLKIGWLFSLMALLESYKQKLCIHCKYFVKGLFQDDQFARCQKYPQYPVGEIDANYLVTGKKREKKIEYYYCSTARNFDDLCGEKGKEYVYRKGGREQDKEE